MNKKVSKALAAVLSAAMAASAFAMSTSASFAAPNISISVDPIEVSLTEASKSYNLEATNSYQVAVADSTAIEDAIKAKIDDQNVEVTYLNDVSDWTSSNTNLAEVNPTTGVVTVKDINITSRQEVTFTKTVKVELGGYENGQHDATKSTKTTAEVKINVVAAIYPDGANMILPESSTDTTTGYIAGTSIPDSNKTVSINEEADFGVYQVHAYQGGLAYFYKVSETNGSVTQPGDGTTLPNLTGLTYSASNSIASVGSSDGSVDPQTPSNVKTGSTTITATATDASGKAVTIQSASVTVDDTYLFEDSDQVTVDTTYGQETKTEISDYSQNSNRSVKYDVTGMDIIADNDTGSLSVSNDKAVLGNITVSDRLANDDATSVKSISITAGTVGDITTDGPVTVGSTSMTGDATVGNIDAAGTVTINGSNKAEGPAVTVGTVDGDAGVNVTAYDAKNSNGQEVGGGDVTVGDITAAGAVALKAGTAINTMTLGSVSGVEGNYADCPYTATLTVNAGTFDLGDLLYFGSVTIAQPAYVTAGSIDTGAKGTADNNKSVTSSLKVDGRLTVDSIKVNTVSNGSGTIIAPVDSVEVTGTTGATGTTLLVEDARVGDVLYTSTSSNNNMFLMPGVTAVESTDSGKNIYTYTVDSLEFRGILMEQTGTVGVGTDGTTLSLVKIPFTTNLPEGVSIVWEADKDSVTLTPSADGLSCQVAATGYTENNINDSNNVTVTASLYKDGKPYSALDTLYASTSVNLSLTNAAPVAEPFTVKVTDLNGNTTTCAADGSTVIEVPQSTSFRVEMTSGTSFPESQLDYHAANGEVAGTNTISAWNGTSGVYEVYAAGGVGEQASMWANGQRIFQIRVTSRPFTSDTTIDFNLKVGQTYTFAINPNDKTADFTFNTANGDALQTSIVKGAYPDANGVYYCKVKATQAAGKIGVYCTLDGVLYKVFTVNTIA